MLVADALNAGGQPAAVSLGMPYLALADCQDAQSGGFDFLFVGL
jgi:hypothetical protein